MSLLISKHTVKRIQDLSFSEINVGKQNYKQVKTTLKCRYEPKPAEIWKAGQGEPQMTSILGWLLCKAKELVSSLLLLPFLGHQESSILSFKDNYGASKPYAQSKLTFLNYFWQYLLPTLKKKGFFPSTTIQYHCQFLEAYKELKTLPDF